MADVVETPDRKVTFGGADDLEGSAPASSETKDKLRKKSSLKMASSTSKKREAGTSVSFLEVVTVRELPSEEADDAMNTRKGAWEAAPNHDELWDGDSKSFWEEEKTVEEVRRIVVIRQMRMALQYNLGYAFYSMVANFKKRRKPSPSDPTKKKMSVGMEDVVPQYETPGAEETAIRKEVRELFADSVKGLDFPDLVQDRESFDKIYSSTNLNISEIRRAPGLGLIRIEALVDEIMNTEEICCLLDVEYEKEAIPEKGRAELEAQEKIDSAVGKEERRRGERRASIEALNHGIPPFGERRASIEAKRRSSLEPSAIITPNNADDDEPIFPSAGRVQARTMQRRPSNSTSTIKAAEDGTDVTDSSKAEVANVATKGASTQYSAIGHFFMLLLGFFVILITSAYKSFSVPTQRKEGVQNTKGSGLVGWLVPLLILLAVFLYR